eukprot:15458257-Alexandrium_andersonii.AAC.1
MQGGPGAERCGVMRSWKDVVAGTRGSWEGGSWRRGWVRLFCMRIARCSSGVGSGLGEAVFVRMQERVGACVGAL